MSRALPLLCDPRVDLAPWPPGDYPALAATLDLWLRPQGPRLAHEYPLLFRPAPDLIHFATRGPDGALLAHAALFLRHVVGTGVALPVAMLSCVAVHPEFRGNGLGSRIVAHALDQARARGAAVALLWAERESFYGRLGLRRSGRELVFALEPRAFLGAWPEPVPARAEHVPGILALHARAPVRMQRGVDDLARLLGIPRLETYVLPEKGAPEAYLCLGKGLDLAGTIHEIGGKPRLVEALLGALVTRKRPQALSLLLAPWEQELARMLATRGAVPAEGALGLATVLDWRALERFSAAIGPAAAAFRGPWPFLPFHLGGLDSI